MSIAFDSLKFSRNLIAAGVPEKQAIAFAEGMAEALVIGSDTLVTKDYLDARLEALETRMGGKFLLLTWMIGLGFTVLIIPQLQAWLS